MSVVVGAASGARPQNPAPATSLVNALPPDASGEQIFKFACATCHAADGAGAGTHVVGFALPLPNGHDFPDFNDCATNTVEPAADWMAVVHRGGPVRALDRRMPAFGDALSAEQIERVVHYLWSFCSDIAWPRGELNLPRAFFTEKAFPENEAVVTTSIATSGSGAVNNEFLYERRLGARGQFEVAVPVAMQQQPGTSNWTSGLGDVEVAVRRTWYHDVERGSIFAAGGALVLPTGNDTTGLGNGFVVVEPFAMFGQMLGSSGFLQLHGGVEVPTDSAAGTETFLRTAAGYTFAQDQGFGRVWTPMLEVLLAKPEDHPTEWDVVPQVQISLSKLQHVLLNVGVRVPLNERAERKPQVLTYLLWDWFDGGLFGFWK